MEERSLSLDFYTEVGQWAEAVESLVCLDRTGLVLDNPGMGSYRTCV